METIEISRESPEAFERDIARRLQRQVSEWKAVRSPTRTHTASGVLVERRFRRRPSVERLST